VQSTKDIGVNTRKRTTVRNTNYVHDEIRIDFWNAWSRDSAVGIATGYGLDD
jgi:hypothetical protein